MTAEPGTVSGYDWIVIDAGLLGGQPVVKGTRLSVAHILACLAEGMTAQDIELDYPGFPPESLSQILQYASEQIDRRSSGDDAAA